MQKITGGVWIQAGLESNQLRSWLMQETVLSCDLSFWAEHIPKH